MTEVTAQELEQLLAEGKQVVADFFAPWCVPCKQLIPRLEAISADYKNVTFVKVNVDDNMEFAVQNGVRSVPTVMVFNGQEKVSESKGVQTDAFYKDILNNL